METYEKKDNNTLRVFIPIERSVESIKMSISSIDVQIAVLNRKREEEVNLLNKCQELGIVQLVTASAKSI